MKRILFLFICFLHLVDHAFGQGYKFEWEDKFSTIFDISAQNNYKICVKQYDSTIDLDPGSGVFNLPGSGFALIKFDTNDNFIWAKPNAIDYNSPVLIKLDLFDNIIVTEGTPYTYRDFGNTALHKFDSQGNRIFTVSLPLKSLNKIEVDSNNNIFIFGGYNPDYQNDYKSTFVEKISPQGNELWTKKFVNIYGGWSGNISYSMALDRSGNVYCLIQGGNVDADPSAGSYLINSQLYSCFISKLNNNGDFLWAKLLPSRTDAYMADEDKPPYQVAIGKDNNPIITGMYRDTVDFDTGLDTFKMSTSSGSINSYITKWDSNANFIWAKQLESSSQTYTYIHHSSIDKNGNINITGSYKGQVDLDPSEGHFILKTNSAYWGTRMFYSELDPNGNFIWGNSFKDTVNKSSYGYQILTDNNENLYLAGRSDSIVITSGSMRLFTKKLSPCVPSIDTLHITACNNYLYNGVTHDTSGWYINSFVNSSNCDSIVCIDLNISNGLNQTLQKSACNSYTLNGITYTNSGTYYQTQVNGCDSITLNLQIGNQASYATLIDTACRQYSYFGQTYTQSGNYTQILTNSNGCDSIVQLQLTIKTDTIINIIHNAVGCTSYVFNGQTYTNAGLYQFVYPRSNGCDSIIYFELYNLPSACVTPNVYYLSLSYWSNSYAAPVWSYYYEGSNLYNLRYKKVSSSTWTIIPNINGLTTILTGLSANTQYEYQIEAICNCGTSGYSTSKVWTTSANCTSTFDPPSSNGIYIPIGLDIHGTISAPSDTDRFNIIALKYPLYVSLSNLPNNYDLKIYFSTGPSFYTTYSYLGSSSNAGSNSEYFTINSPIPGQIFNPQSYSIQVISPSGAFSASSCYTLRVDTSLSACSPITSGLSLSVWGNTYATCIWPSVQGASSYNLRYKTVASNSWTYINNIAATSQMLNGLSPSTTYEFQVYPNCSAGVSTFSYSKQWTTTSNCQGTYDKNTNNTITGSGIIPLNIDVFGMIHTASDLDYYQFSVSNLNPVMISLTNLPANYNISLLDSNYAIKGNSSSWGNNSEYITFVPPAIGKYYVKVFGVNNVFNSNACYTLKILDNTIPCTAPALSSLSMSVLGNTYGTCIWNSVPGALYYNLRYRAITPPNPNAWITVSNIYGNMTALSGLSANTLYVFQVEAICTSGTSGFSPAKNFTTTSTCQGSYDNTSNNLSAGAAIVPSNTDIFGRIQTSTDVDFYKFVATTTDPLNIILSNLPANYNLYLYNASNTLLSSSLNNSTAIEVINFTPTSIGDYFIKVEGVSGAFNASQCYSLNINNSNLNCGMPAGLTLSVWGNTYATCLWNIVPGAISYNLRYKAVNSANWNTINNIAINSQSLSGLSASTNYEFQVQANCSSASSLFSSSKLFSTSATCQGTYDNASNATAIGGAIIPFNTQIFGRIESSSDIDNYKFTTLTPGTLHISLKTLPANYDLIIYNASLAQIASSNNIGTADELIALSNVTPGLYYAKIVGQGGAFNTSQCYTFKVSTTGSYLKENDPLDQQELEEETFTVYPNPTTGMITLAYTLQTDDHVDIVMYDLTGRKIQNLQNQDQQKGEYKIQFDMKSLNQASGVYLIRLKTNSQDVKRKLMYKN